MKTKLLALVVALLTCSLSVMGQINSLSLFRDTVFNTAGAPVVDATITVFLANTSTKATIFSSRAAAAKSNPFTTAPFGNYDFWAVPGLYDVEITGTGIPTTLIQDVAFSSISIRMEGQTVTPIGCVTGDFYFNSATGQWTLCGTGGINVPGPFTVGGSFLPAVTGNDLGSDPFRWDAFLAATDIESLGSTVVPLKVRGTSTHNANVMEIEKNDGTDFLTVDKDGVTETRILNDTYYNVKSYGAVGDGVADDTVAIQAAIDAADTPTRKAIVFFPCGSYSITAAIDPKSVSLLGPQPNNCVRIVWDGAVGTTVFTFTTQGSFRLLSGFNFRAGANLPGPWFSFSGVTADIMLRMENLHFGGSNGDCIEFLSGWFNLHMRNIRWDGCQGWAIDAKAGATQFQASFLLEDFTYDYNDGTATPPGFIRFDNTASSSSSSTIRVSDARIEVNTAWGGNQSLFAFSGANARVFDVHIADLAYQDVVGMGSDTLFYNEGTTTSQPISFTGVNLTFSGMANVLGGDWAGLTIPMPAVGRFNWLSFGASGNHLVSGTEVESVQFVLGDIGYSSRLEDDADDRFAIDTDGAMAWCDGAGSCPDELKVLSGRRMQTSIGTNVEHDRLYLFQGTSLVAGDFSLSAGWGNTATVTSVTGKDTRGTFTVTSVGTGQVADPTITFTFTDGPWNFARPFVLVAQRGGAQLTVATTWTVTTTTIVITWNGTPVAAEFFTFEFIVVG